MKYLIFLFCIQLILGGCGKVEKKAELDDNSFEQGTLERTFKPDSMSGNKLPHIIPTEDISVFTTNKYGFEEKTGSIRKSIFNDRKTIYTKNKYGIEERAGSIRDSLIDDQKDIYTKNNYGFEEKTGSIRRSFSNENRDIYTKNNYGFEEKTGSLRKNYIGGYDIYKINEYGFEEKVGSTQAK